MTLSPMVAEWVAAYEQEHGHKPTELVLQIVEHIEKVEKKFTELGQKDVQEGKIAYTSGFSTLAARTYRLDVVKDHETVQAIADLWQAAYMDGYNNT